MRMMLARGALPGGALLMLAARSRRPDVERPSWPESYTIELKPGHATQGVDSPSTLCLRLLHPRSSKGK